MVAIDAHVHFHRQRSVAPTLTAAAANFRILAGAMKRKPLGVLLLAQAAGEQVFEWLREQARAGPWVIEAVESEPQCLRTTSASDELLVVCGRQIAAEQGLEILALGTDRQFADGLGLEHTLAAVREANAVPVLPWGFGKWFGRRGRRIRELLRAEEGGNLWVGDNGGRLQGLRRPKLIDEAESRSIGVLPGTDPFPFARDYRRVGSFGCVLRAVVDRARPWHAIASRLSAVEGSPEAYGRATGWYGFVFKQAWMQFHMRIHGRPE